jgi:hypothetical protein
MFVSYDTFIFFTDDILFSMLQNYLDIFLLCDQIFTSPIPLPFHFPFYASKLPALESDLQ